jgi:hypothetical protein
MKPTLAVLTIAFVVSGTTTCSKSPTGLDTLPENLTTVQAAVDLITNDTVYVVATCGGNTPLNCPGGVPGSPVPLVFTRDSVHIVEPYPPDSSYYSFTAWANAVTVRDIPITAFGIDCGLAIDTRAAPAPNIQVSGIAHFTSQTDSGPINRLDISSITIAGLDTGDVSINGGVSCTLVSFGLSFFLGTLTSTLQDMEAQGLCGAPGSTVFEPCPPKPVAARVVTIRGTAALPGPSLSSPYRPSAGATRSTAMPLRAPPAPPTASR